MLFAHSRDVINCKAVQCDAQKLWWLLAAPIWSNSPHFHDANDRLLMVTKLHLDVSAVHG